MPAILSIPLKHAFHAHTIKVRAQKLMKKTISIIIPVYNEAENIPDILSALSVITDMTDHNSELIFVNDGSTDKTSVVLKEMALTNPACKIISFSRNFGSHAACLAGLMNACGDACVFISADLQDPPELILEMIKKMEEGYDIVIGARERDVKQKRFLPDIYYKLVRKFALKNMPETGTDVFLINRKVINEISAIKEKNTSIFGLILWSGFKQAVITYKKRVRQKGASKWTISKKIKLFIDTFVSFSYFPIRLMSLSGIIFACIGFIYAAIVVFNRLFFSNPIEGWTSLMVVLLVVSGIQMLMLGVLGEYLWRSFDETRNRPPFIISEKIGFD